MYCSSECNKRSQTLRSYGITPEIYAEHEKRGCAICGGFKMNEGKEKLAIDHDHETGKFRGLLCSDCNSYRVGMNTVETAERVLEYLSHS